VILDFLKDGLVLLDTHTHQLIASIILIENITRLLLQLLHMRTTQLAPRKKTSRDAYRINICRNLTKSQCSSLSTSMTPQGYSRARTILPSRVLTAVLEPTIAKGILDMISRFSEIVSSSSSS